MKNVKQIKINLIRKDDELDEVQVEQNLHRHELMTLAAAFLDEVNQTNSTEYVIKQK